MRKYLLNLAAFTWLLGTSLLLLGCKPEIRIQLEVPAALPSPVFLILPAQGSDETQRFYHLYVEDERKQNVWEIQAPADAQDHGLTRIVYGTTPSEFKTLLPPQALKPGQSYRLSLYGSGLGSLEFSIGENGDVKAR